MRHSFTCPSLFHDQERVAHDKGVKQDHSKCVIVHLIDEGVSFCSFSTGEVSKQNMQEAKNEKSSNSKGNFLRGEDVPIQSAVEVADDHN